MVSVIEGGDPLEAWARGVRHLISLPRGEAEHLVTQIERPTEVAPRWYSDYNPRKIIATVGSLHSVVNMLLPDCILRDVHKTRDERYQAAWEKIDKWRQRGLHLSNWRETYFERLTRLESGTNQLENIIRKMNSWPNRRVAAFYAHTSFMELDGLTPIGNPCLQYLQFMQQPNGQLDLVAVYRNHDFLAKVLGNYIGLGRLLKFVANETDAEIGTLTCFSIHAYLAQKRKMSALADMALN